ncbi:hypothetical protein CCMA1212_008193 [Trichoderma ghanense]|uniref:Uncharacterized protein n=1 Tax=Trichoderma ghanense TaxID=65468 RepID=A0ABY2GW01_9HYPO
METTQTNLKLPIPQDDQPLSHEEIGATQRETTSQFWTEAKGNKNCSVALGLMPVHNAVKEKGRDIEKAWRAFVIAWMKTKERGRVLVIQDPEPQYRLTFAMNKCASTQVCYNTSPRFVSWEECAFTGLERN